MNTKNGLQALDFPLVLQPPLHHRTTQHPYPLQTQPPSLDSRISLIPFLLGAASVTDLLYLSRPAPLQSRGLGLAMSQLRIAPPV